MRNTIISIISAVMIAAYTVFSAVYIGSFTQEIKQQINYADINGYTIAAADNLVEILEKNMPVLILTSSKDHIDYLEDCVINLRYAVEYEDKQNIMVYRGLLLKMADEMNSMNKSPV